MTIVLIDIFSRCQKNGISQPIQQIERQPTSIRKVHGKEKRKESQERTQVFALSSLISFFFVHNRLSQVLFVWQFVNIEYNYDCVNKKIEMMQELRDW